MPARRLGGRHHLLRNDYRNKIVARNTVYATTSSGADVLQWTSA